MMIDEDDDFDDIVDTDLSLYNGDIFDEVLLISSSSL